jgi:indolepyruvate ferredoxin oxidoreductase
MHSPPAIDKQRSFTLNDKFTLEEGTIILNGVQALMRLPMDQHRADKRRGLNTAMLISGYRGSPVGGLDVQLSRQSALLEAHQVRFMPGLNEELAATALFGSQLVNTYPAPKYDGVLGMWYGKAPGVDRSGDAFKHANLTGVARNGGVLAVTGDDPAAKSSTVPSGSEAALYAATMPILYPGTVEEVITMGLAGFALSRYSGAWVGFKFVTNVADEFSTAYVSPTQAQFTQPNYEVNGKPWQHSINTNLFAPFSVLQERDMVEGRLEAARRFAYANDLNRIVGAKEDAWLGIVATGKTYFDVCEALMLLGLDEGDLLRYGIRLLKLGMIYPLEPNIVREFARGLQEIVVVEEKRSFIELFLMEQLYNLPDRPRVVGKNDENGVPLLPAYGEMDADIIATALHNRLRQRLPNDALIARSSESAQLLGTLPIINVSRSPYFCSGCPHNRSTRVPEGSIANAGIGCHTMALFMNRQHALVTQMGGEGAQWVGAAPFTETQHIFQNMGDGTLMHSGSLAVRQAVAAGTNITFKVLYNSVTGMTGGQHIEREMSVPELAHLFKVEGVRKILLMTDDVKKYKNDPLGLPSDVEVWHRDRLEEAQLMLREIKGVSVLIYDQHCAAELRRMRKRGKAVEPSKHIFINEAVCEGCGDCGKVSNCLSVVPVETEFGRKTQIHQSSCNKDYSCLNGNCPAFVTVESDKQPVKSKTSSGMMALPIIENLPVPTQKVPDRANIYISGIGGTGVVTINQILGTAAYLDGKVVRAMDQIGLSQKGGSVVSNIKIQDRRVHNAETRPESACAFDVSNAVSEGDADVLLVFDILTATTNRNLARARKGRTVAVVSSSEVPTGTMVRDAQAKFPVWQMLKTRLDAVTNADENVYLDAELLSEVVFGDHMMSNMLVVGAAFQAGLLPLSSSAIEQAIVLNGASAEKNTTAFRMGRQIVANPTWLNQLNIARPGEQKSLNMPLSPKAEQLVNWAGASGELRRLLVVRVPELIAYQNVAYAQTYVEFVQTVWAAEQSAGTGKSLFSEAVARYLHKLMTYKDEYEVARLHLRPEFKQSLKSVFGEAANVRYQLHPPILKVLGLKRKIGFGAWFDVVYRVLYTLRGLRGTAFDVFGYDTIRKVERNLIGEYRVLIEKCIAEGRLNTSEGYASAVKLAELPDLIRGYDEVKLENVARYRAALAQ